MRSQGSSTVLPWGMMNSVSRVMLTRIALPGMGMSLMDLPAKAKFSGSRISFRLAVPPPSESSWRMVSVSISRSRMWLRLSVPQTTVSTPRVCSSSRFLGLEARATVRSTPNSRLTIWQATRLSSSLPVPATKASQLATSAVRRVSKLMASPHTTGTSNESARLRHNASCGSMMVTLWWWASRLWARYMPTLPPPAIQTFIELPRFPKRNVSKRRAYLASARNTACSVSTVGQTVSSS